VHRAVNSGLAKIENQGIKKNKLDAAIPPSHCHLMAALLCIILGKAMPQMWKVIKPCSNGKILREQSPLALEI